MAGVRDAMVGAALLFGSVEGAAFSLQFPLPAHLPASVALPQAARWSVGALGDGLQVSIEPGFAADLGAVTEFEASLVEGQLRAGLAMWESPVLSFDPTFEDPAAVEGTGAGSEVDVFAVPSTHPVFAGTDFFGFTTIAVLTVINPRPLTNGQSAPGQVIQRADVYINADLVLAVAAQLGLNSAQQLDALRRLFAHEIGHALGLGHSNGNDPYGPTTYWDLDAVATNPIVIDAADPFDDFLASTARDDTAVMSNRPCGEPFVAACPALFATALRPDDAGGRDVLYPVVVPVAPGAVVSSGPLGVVVTDPASQTSDRLLAGPPLAIGDGVAIDGAGDVLVADSGAGAVLRIDAATGAAAVLASGGALVIPNRLVVGPDGTIYVADVGGGVVAVDPETGVSSLVAALEVFDIAIDPGGSELYVTSGDAIVRVALPGGAQSVVAAGGLMDANLGIAVEASGSLLVLTDVDDSFEDRLVRVSADGSTQSVVHSAGGSSGPATDPGYYDLALDAQGRALLAAAGPGILWRIDPANGAKIRIGTLELPFGVAAVLPACADGIDNDGDGRWDASGADADAGCASPDDNAETEAGLACDDGVDNDGDGFTDFPADPGCQTSSWALENPQCDNDLDDDGDGRVDWNGPGTPDPQCAGQPSRNRERASCGLGAELAFVLAAIAVRRRSRPVR